MFALLWLISAHLNSGNSDGATVVLEGQSLAHGNLLLHGWTLSYDSFWTIDALFYAVGVLIVGNHGYLLHAIPAVIATLVIALACAIAAIDTKGHARNIAQWFIVVCLVFPSAIWSQFYLAGPYHVGTVLWSLMVFYLCYAAPTRLRYLLAVLFVAAGILGDLQMITLGVVPLVLAGLIAMLRRWSLTAGLPQVVVAAVGSLLALAVRKLANLLGTFTLAPTHPAAGWSGIIHNLSPALRYGSNLFGVTNGSFSPPSSPGLTVATRVVELALVCLAIVLAAAQLLGGLVTDTKQDGPAAPWRLNDLLVIAVVADVATFAYLATTGSNAEARYLSAGLIYGVLLAARYVGRLAVHLRTKIQRVVLGVIGLVGTGALALGGVELAAAATVAQPIVQLGQLLQSHHLTRGIGGYWTASITTVQSNGAVVVRPVIIGPNGTIVRYQRQSDASWYRGQRFQFLVYNTNVAVDDITRAAARATFGAPEHVYAFENYRVLVYRSPITVSINGYAA